MTGLPQGDSPDLLNSSYRITADIEVIQERLARTAYNDIFRMMESLREQTKSGINPVEIDALREEALMRMGPVIGRVYGTLRTRVLRHLSIMARRRLLPQRRKAHPH